MEDTVKAAARTASPRYRDHLRSHGIHIDVFGGLRKAPAQVKVAATAILEGKRVTPEPSAADLSQAQAKIAGAIEKDEGGTRDAFIGSNLFEAPANYLNRTTTGSSVLFIRDGLPHTHGFGFRQSQPLNQISNTGFPAQSSQSIKPVLCAITGLTLTQERLLQPIGRSLSSSLKQLPVEAHISWVRIKRLARALIV